MLFFGLSLQLYPYFVDGNPENSLFAYAINRGYYMSDHVLLNLLNKLEKSDKVRGLPSILSLFRNKFNKFHNTGA